MARTHDDKINFVQQTQPNNRSHEYNCHSWVQGALMSLRDAGYISSQTFTHSVDGMLEARLEAADEEWA